MLTSASNRAHASAKEYYAREAKERMTAGINQHSPVQKFAQAEKGKARDKAGEQFGVSGQSVNVRRRHLSKGQAAIAAAKLKAYYADEAKARKGGNQHVSKVENLPPSEIGKARDKAGEQFGVSGKTVDDAEAVIKNGAHASACVGTRKARVRHASLPTGGIRSCRLKTLDRPRSFPSLTVAHS